MKKAIVVLSAAMLAVAGCSAGGGTGTTNPGTYDPNGILRYATELTGSGVSGHLDPGKSTSVCDFSVMAPIYGTLINRDPANGKAVAGLAEKWTAVDDRTLELTLRANLKFTNGAAFDAAAVVAGLTHNATTKGGQTSASLGPLLDKATAVDARTVRIALKQPVAGSLPLILSGREGMIIAPGTEDTADKQPVGAGPFRLDNMTAGQQITIKKNPDYWNAANIKLGGVQWINTQGGPPTINALLGGDADLAQITPDQVDALKRDPGIKVTSVPGGGYYKLNWNLAQAPFSNVQFRQALNHAINRDQIAQAVFGGQGEVAWGPYPSTFFGYNADKAKKYPYDPQQAKDLLQQAGFGSGVKITAFIPPVTSFQRFGEILQQQFKAVGVDLALVPSTNIVQDYFTDKKQNATVITWPPRPDPADTLLVQFTPGTFNNTGNYNDPQLTDLVKQIRATTDDAQKAALYKQAYGIVVDSALDLPAVFPPLMSAAGAKVGGTVRQFENCQGIDLASVQINKA